MSVPRSNLYIEVDGRPHRADDIGDWARWIQEFDRTVGEDVIGGARVRTIFVGVDSAQADGTGPLVYQTYITGGPLDGRIWRRATRDDATAAHYMAIGRCLAAAARLGLGTSRDR